MDLKKFIVNTFIFAIVNTLSSTNDSNKNNVIKVLETKPINDIETVNNDRDEKLNEIFGGVYSDCVLKFSYLCLQRKTLLYLEELNHLSEVSVIGDYVKFVKLNTTEPEESDTFKFNKEADTKELGSMIDRAIDRFFNSHIIKFSALGRDITMPRNVEEFVGRKKRKGGGGGGHGGDDGGKKKMMMMAMMCMKMKLMMMVPAMMGMMGMMSFKGMMFSMMSFMISKMMLLMKLLEKKGGAGFGGSAGGGDGGWPAAGGSGGAWMPAGGQDFGGGGYDANAQWQSRSILEKLESKAKEPIITYVIPAARYVNKDKRLTVDEVNRNNNYGIPKRRKRSVRNEIENIDSRKKLAAERNDSNYNTNDNFVLNTSIDTNTSTFINDPKIFKIISEILKKYLLNTTAIKYSKTNKNETIVDRKSKHFIKDADEILKPTNKHRGKENEPRSRSKRGILEILQNSYIYWMSKILGIGNNRRTYMNPKYKMINGLKYVYYPIRPVVKAKVPKETQTSNRIKTVDEGFKPIIAAEDFNKGEIIDVAESRMNRKKFNKMKNTVNDTMDDNPWQ